MTQADIMEFLEKNKGTFYTATELAHIFHITLSSAGRATKQIVKRDEFQMKLEFSEYKIIKRIGYKENE